MAKYLNIKFEDEDEYERAKSAKRSNGLTWRGMILHATDDLEGEDDSVD